MVEGSAFFAYNILRGHVGATRVQEETPMIRQFTKPVEFAVAMVCDMSTLAGCYKWHRNFTRLCTNEPVVGVTNRPKLL